MRTLFLQKNPFQIRYNACHERGWSDSYLLLADDIPAGYGSLKGMENIHDRDAVFEFFLKDDYLKHSHRFFKELLEVSKASFIECQTNELNLTSMLFQFAIDIQGSVILFEDGVKTAISYPGVSFRKRKETDKMFQHHSEPEGQFILETNTEVIASGGYLTHYNPPFADLFMEVHKPYRRKGYGAFILQEVKNACYLAGYVPAARCKLENKASYGSLLKAGMKPCAMMISGRVRSPVHG